MVSSLLYLALTVILLSKSGNLSDAQLVTSPEPIIPEMGLYLYTASVNPTPVMELKDGSKICPTDYPTGFTIRCVTKSDKVRFLVNGRLVMKEYHQPYFIAGDYKNRARAWTDYPRSSSVTIRCKGRDLKTNYVARSVSFLC